MSVTNNQLANQTTFNNAFISRTQNSTTVGKIGLNNPESASIADAQKAINDVTDNLATHEALDIHSVTSLAIDIDDAVVKKHEQNTDTHTSNNSFGIGDNDLIVNKDIVARTGQVDEPKLRYNVSTLKWEFSHDGVEYKEIGSGGGANLISEIPLGAIDGVNVNYTLAELPSGVVMLFIDGVYRFNGYTLAGQVITLDVPLQFGQQIEVVYGSASGGAPVLPASYDLEVEYITLTNDMITNKELTLVGTPKNALKVIVDVLNGTAQEYSVDYVVITNKLNWNGLGLEAKLQAGDKIRITYLREI